MTNPAKPCLEPKFCWRVSLTATQYKGMTDTSGRFQFVVPPGDYRLLLSAPGYKTFRVSKFPLVSGDRATANPVLEPGDTNEIQTGLSTSVTSRTGLALAGKGISDLPENQRNFVNLVQLSTGANEGSENNANAGSRPGAQHQSSAISLGGQPETTNNSTIDGIDNNERINSQIALHPSVDAIAEVQVLANAYPANFGHAGGGVLNVITKSGVMRSTVRYTSISGTICSTLIHINLERTIQSLSSGRINLVAALVVQSDRTGLTSSPTTRASV